MQISKVSSKYTITAFHDFHVKQANNYENWIPHLKQDIEKIFDPKRNKLLNNGKAERWILQDNGKTIGRIAAFINSKTKNSFKQPTGGIGFFDCINDQNAANLLFDTGKKWLEENEIEAMDGPINFGEKNQYWGLLIENFDRENTYGMNYNPPYYKELFENYGFQVYYHQICNVRDIYMPMQDIIVAKYNRINSMKGMELRTVKGLSIEQIASDFVEVYNDAWSGHEGLKGMKKAAAVKLFKTLKPIMDRDIVYFVFHHERPIAFFLNVPNLNFYFKKFNGNFNLINKLRFLVMQKTQSPDVMVGVIFGVVKDFQGKGVEAAMIKWSHEVLKKKKYKDIVMTWVGDFNPRMLRVLDNLGSELYQKYSTYRYLFNRKILFERAPIIGERRKKKSS